MTFARVLLTILIIAVAVCSARSKHKERVPLEEQLKYVVPLTGCWEEVQTKDGMICRQYFGYSHSGNSTLHLKSGFNNYLLVNNQFLTSPITEFEADTNDAALFAIRVPCQNSNAYAMWTLGASSALSRIGDITHHCKHVTDPSATASSVRESSSLSKKKTDKNIDKHAESWASQHKIIMTPETPDNTGLIQLVFGEPSKCARIPELSGVVGADLLGISMHAPADLCTVSGATQVQIGLRWALSSNCMSHEHETETFAEVTIPCGNAQLLFGLSDNKQYIENEWPKTLDSAFELPRAGQIFYAARISRALETLLSKTKSQRQHSADSSLWIELYEVSTSGRATLDSHLISGSVLRVHTSAATSHVALTMRDSAAADSVIIRPLHDCTKVLQSGICMSWFGYDMYTTDGSAATIQHRPVGLRNRFSVAPYDRGQITYFKPGQHNYATMVEWNCTSDGSGAMRQLQWSLDGVATATPLGPACRLGCDGRIDSTKQYDDCGVCGGDGSSCVDTRHEYFVDSRGNTLRKYCDGVHEQRSELNFDQVETFNTRQGTLLNPGSAYHVSLSSSKTMVLLNSAMPPKDRLGLGTPNVAFDGGVGIGANGAFSNQEAQRMVLAFASDLGSPGCMKFAFEKPSQVHSLTVLNVPTTCKVSDSIIHSSSSLLPDNQPVRDLEAENSYFISKLQQSRCVGQQHCEAEADYFSRDYYYINVTDSRDTRNFCYYNYHCTDGNPCTSDVCVHGCCMHSDVYGCCSCDDDCSGSQPAGTCCEYYCCAHTRRCMRRHIENCCEEDSDCAPVKRQQDSCIEHFCNGETQQCDVRGIVGCCHSNADCAGLFDQSDQCSIPICGIDNTCHMLPKHCDSGQCNPQTGQCVTATPSGSATASVTPSASPTVSNSQTPSASATPTPSNSPTASSSSTTSGSATPTPSNSATSSNSATPSGTNTPTPSQTPTASSTATRTPSQTPSISQSSTATMSSSATPSGSATPTSSSTSTPSSTPTQSSTSTMTPTSSSTPTPSGTQTPTSSSTSSTTPTMSSSPTPTVSASSSATPTTSISSSATPTISASQTATPTASVSSSQTPTVSASPTASQTSSVSSSQTPTSSGTATPSSSQTPTPSTTTSGSVTPTRTPSISTTSTASQSQTPTISASSTASVTPTRTPTSSGTSTHTPTPSTTPSPCCPPGFQWHPVLQKCYYTGPFSESTPSITPSATASVGSTPSPTPSVTPTMTWWPSETPTPSRTPSSSHVPGCPVGYQWNILLSICVWIGLKRSDDIPRYVQPLNYHGLPAVANEFNGIEQQAPRTKRYVSELEYSSSIIVKRANGEAIRLEIPPGAGNNGVHKFELAGVDATSVEVCMCDSHGAVADIDYTFPGSGKVVDTCGECGGNSSKCTNLDTTTVRVEHKFSTDPITVRRLRGEGHDSVYEMCYYHQRTHLDADDFSGRAVRLSFGPISSTASLRQTGTCDSSVPVPMEKNGELFCTMFGGPQTFFNRALWSFQLLGECNVDRPLSECPAGAGQGGYRMCSNFTLPQLTRCKDAAGQGILSSEDSTQSRMAYHGALYATEFEPVSCKSEYAGQRVVHSTIKRFTMYTSFSGSKAAVDFTDGWADFDTDVAGVVCLENGNLAVTLRTSVAENNRLLNPTIASNSLLDPASGTEIPVGIGEIHSAAASNCVVGSKCEQTWYISSGVSLSSYVGELKINFQLERESTLYSVVSTGLRLNANCRATLERYKNTIGKAMILPDGGQALDQSDRAAVMSAASQFDVHTDAEPVLQNSNGYAATLTLFHDKAFSSPYASSGPFVQHYKHGSQLYGTLELSTIEEIENHEFAPHLVIDKMYVCYSMAKEAYKVYQPTKPHNSGCLADGNWVVSELTDSGRVTHAGRRVEYTEFSYDNNLLHLAFSFKARVPSDAPLFVDARWHVEWGKALLRGITVNEIAATRIKQHLIAGTHESDLSTFHFILPPRNIQHTRELTTKNRLSEARLHAAHLVADQIGIGPREMRSLVTGKVDYVDGLMSKNAPIVRDGIVYPTFNDEMWSSASVAHFYTECQEPETQRVSSGLGAQYHDAKCGDCGSHCKRSDSLFYQPQYRCDECCGDDDCNDDQWNECPWNECAPPACFSGCDSNFGWPVWCGQLLLWPIIILIVCAVCIVSMCPMSIPSFVPEDYETCHAHDDKVSGKVYVRHAQRVRTTVRRRRIDHSASTGTPLAAAPLRRSLPTSRLHVTYLPTQE